MWCIKRLQYAVFLDIDPISEGHVLILPKQHYVDVESLDQTTRLDIMDAAALMSRLLKKQYEPDGITFLQNGGYFNDVGHYHMHAFPRYQKDGFDWQYPSAISDDDYSLAKVAENLRAVLHDGLSCFLE